jgi:ketosteroid isomerase-like protein
VSEENVKLVVGVFDSTNAGDWEAVADAYSDDTALVVHADFGAFGSEAIGKPAVIRWFADWFRQFAPDYRFEVHEARAAPEDRVFLVATHHGRGRVSGVPVTQESSYVYTLRAGKIARTEVWAERESALAAAGISDRS